MEQIKSILAEAQHRSWEEQVDLHDRLLDLNKDMLSLLTGF